MLQRKRWYDILCVSLLSPSLLSLTLSSLSYPLSSLTLSSLTLSSILGDKDDRKAGRDSTNAEVYDVLGVGQSHVLLGLHVRDFWCALEISRIFHFAFILGLRREYCGVNCSNHVRFGVEC